MLASCFYVGIRDSQQPVEFGMNKTDSIYKSIMFGLWAILSLLMCLLLVWKISGQLNFFYSPAYQLLDIDQTIAVYAPQNRFRSHFPSTDSNLHIEMFAAISKAILQNGEGLANIEYMGLDGNNYTLLHEAETLHLEDVARLIAVLEEVGWIAVLLWMILTFAMFRLWKWSLPSFASLAIGITGFTVIGIITVLLAGPEKLFYKLHTIVFPSDHQWFFYYQDSLMTTIMKAPDLFAFIAAVLVVLTLVMFIALLVLVRILNPGTRL